MQGTNNHSNHQPPHIEGIDFVKLRVIIRSSLLWIAFIFIAINVGAYLIVRYTKDRFESVSEIKLDVRNEVSELGINSFGIKETQNADLLSGEIEILRSNLFLSKVLDSIKLDVSYFSRGEVLNHELFPYSPILVEFKIESPQYYNIPFYLEEESGDSFTLQIGESGAKISGRYNFPIKGNGYELKLRKNPEFVTSDEIDFFFIIHSRDALLSYISSNLTVEPLNFAAKTIRVAFQDHNAQKAQAIVKTINSLYLNYSHQQKNLVNAQKIDWLNNEMRQIELKMEDFEGYFKDFTLKNKTNNLDEDLKRTINAINRIDSQRFEYSRRVSEVDRLINGLEAQNFLLTPTLKQILPDYLFTELVRIQALFLEQDKMKLSYSEVTVAYREKQKEITSRSTQATQLLTELKAEWYRRLQDMNTRKRSLEIEFANMPDKSTQFTKNQRFYKLYEEFYLSLMQSKAGFEIAQAGTTPDFKILSPASLAQVPISPNRLMIAGIGLVSSVVVIIFFVGILYIANNKITSLHDLERVAHVPVLGLVPASRHSGKQSFHVINHPKSVVSEAIRTLRTNLDFFRTQSAQRVIAISSTISGEGKSFVALNLGAAMALSRKKVVLIDLDMRKTKVNLPVQVEDLSKGMSTVLIGKENWRNCVLKTEVDLLDYIPSGPNPPNPSELLLNGEFSSILDELKAQYDVIILDTPPVGLVTDGIQAMKHADVSIYIFRANYSKRDFIGNLQRIVSINKISNVTSLLNALPSTGDRSYGYGYGYYEDDGNKKFSQIRSFFKV